MPKGVPSSLGLNMAQAIREYYQKTIEKGLSSSIRVLLLDLY